DRRIKTGRSTADDRDLHGSLIRLFENLNCFKPKTIGRQASFGPPVRASWIDTMLRISSP
ncbi:MAG: hypothetical protein WBF62_14390, partial [Bradyrhizobium sp.]